MIKSYGTFLLFFLISVLLAACSGSQANGPGTAVERYLQAVVSGEPDRIAPLSCADWESAARDEVDSFTGVKANLEAVSCQSVSSSDHEATVTCGGSIAATYNNEITNFPLEGKQFRVIQQSGDWLVCGYAQQP